MKRIITLSVLAVTLLFAACENEPVQTSSGTIVKKFSSSMEDDMWLNRHTIILGFGHTGIFCSKIDTVNRFSFGFSRTFKEIDSTAIPTSIEVSLWTLFKKTGIVTDLVISIDGDGKNIFWAGTDLKDMVKKPDEWKSIKVSYNLPAGIKPTDRVTVYMWNPNNNVCYMDDLEVNFRP